MILHTDNFHASGGQKFAPPRSAARISWTLVRLSAACFGLVCGTLVLSGCGQSEPAPAQPADSTPAVARTQVQRGPLTVTVEVSPAPTRLSDEPTLTLTLDSDPKVKVTPPPFGEALGDFLILDFQNPLPQTKDGRRIQRQIYTLEPTRTGSLQVEPIFVEFVDNRPGADGKRHSVQTESLVIEVNSMIQTNTPSLGDLQDLDAPVDLPSSWPAWIWFCAAAVGLSLFAVVGLLYWRRVSPSKMQFAPLVSPREKAVDAISALIKSGLHETDTKQFYVELTSIVRQYIEDTTSVRAPEQTTEEFLYEISRDENYRTEDRDRLGAFLESADLVKFAAHRPTDDDIERAIQRAREFVGASENRGAA